MQATFTSLPHLLPLGVCYLALIYPVSQGSLAPNSISSTLTIPVLQRKVELLRQCRAALSAALYRRDSLQIISAGNIPFSWAPSSGASEPFCNAPLKMLAWYILYVTLSDCSSWSVDLSLGLLLVSPAPLCPSIKLRLHPRISEGELCLCNSGRKFL